MLTKEYEQAYISSFVKIFTILKNDYDLYVEESACFNYEIAIKKINNELLNKYLSICFQKQNGSLIIICDKNLKDEYKKKIIKDISLSLNEEIFATYKFKELKDYEVYHFNYIKENILVDNKKLLFDLKNDETIINLKFNK